MTVRLVKTPDLNYLAVSPCRQFCGRRTSCRMKKRCDMRGERNEVVMPLSG